MTLGISSLPFELLSNIMVVAYRIQTDTSLGPSDLRRIRVPLSLSSVSGHWREVALCTHEIWDTYLPISWSRTQGVFTSWALTRLFVERSAPRPFKFGVSDFTFPYDLIHQGCLHGLQSALETLQDYAPRCCYLKWEVTSLHDLHPLSLMSSEPLDILDSVMVRFSSDEDLVLASIWGGPDLHLFQNAPLLRKVVLSWPEENSGTTPLHIFLPWEQLTTLELEINAPQMCLDILVQCTNLVSASITTDRWPLDAPLLHGLRRHQTLPMLQKLEFYLTVTDGDESGPWLSCLDLPALKEFGMHIIPEQDAIAPLDDRRILNRFLARSNTITHLDTKYFLDVDELVRTLAHIPRLTELKTRGIRDHTPLFAALSALDDQTRVLAPHLERLEPHIMELATFEVEPLLQLVRRRWWKDGAEPPIPGLRRLKHIQFVTHDKDADALEDLMDGLWPTLKQFVVEGFVWEYEQH
uniref:F-box domain-containing protein n=1 Tax=Mycena chlorophos TaxID=658473 RepID=A0ABQ0MDA1_MYCCL|nr:predicted protein [Mycena chlorophos]